MIEQLFGRCELLAVDGNLRGCGKIAAEDAKRVESKPRVEVEEVLTQRHGVREAQSFWSVGFFTRIPQPKAVRSAEALAGVSSREAENKIVLIKVVKTLCFMSYE